MDHIKVLLMKFAAITITLFAIFGVFYEADFGELFLISLLVTGISYVLGDMFILRKYGNVTATISDFPLAFLSIWILGGMFFGNELPIITLSLLSAFFITCCEPFVHGYVANHFSVERHDLRGQNQLQTEFGEEMDATTLRDKAHDEEKNKEE
ncbi:YndM family protein [Virgibacillus kekensis]|uniref:YndM family protein n=1 Tax=Virgibacillus kekensis TaxID=202261 RepID=A0ABV9DEV9_9BACI